MKRQMTGYREGQFHAEQPLGAETARPLTEQPGHAGSLPVFWVKPFVEGLKAGITTSAHNLRHRDRLADAAVAEAYGALETYAGRFGGWLRVSQVHGARVVTAQDAMERGLQNPSGPGRAAGGDVGAGAGVAADGIVRHLEEHSRAPRLLTVSVADCVPVFLSWPGGYGLLHAGWRGIAAGILDAGFEAAGARPQEIRMHLGPAIGACCYEVGSDVVEALGSVNMLFDDPAPQRRAGDARDEMRWRVDLRQVLARRALDLGANPGSVTSSTVCTGCDSRFHSFRRSKEQTPKLLMLAFIGMPFSDPSPGYASASKRSL
jgi:YfiH family protein